MNIFKGRINRLSFLISQVIVTIFSIVYDKYNLWSNVFNLLGLLELLVIIFAFDCIVKRLHDINKSGWWILASFIPLYNIYLALKLLMGSGDFEENKYGKPPEKGIKFF